MNLKYFNRFFKKIKEDKSGCWIWMGRPNFYGYGQFMMMYKNYRAHRLSYEIHKGKIPNGMHVCHTCDIRLCVNPKHLFLGTAKDNMHDCHKKGRFKGWQHFQESKTHCPHGHEYSAGNTRLAKNRGKYVQRVCIACHGGRANA